MERNDIYEKIKKLNMLDEYEHEYDGIEDHEEQWGSLLISRVK